MSGNQADVVTRVGASLQTSRTQFNKQLWATWVSVISCPTPFGASRLEGIALSAGHRSGQDPRAALGPLARSGVSHSGLRAGAFLAVRLGGFR